MACLIFFTTMAFPEQLAKMFGTAPGFIYWTMKILRVGNYARPCISMQFNSQVILQSLAFAVRATAMSVFGQFFLVIGLMVLMYYIDKTNPMLTLIAWQIQHASTFLLGIILVGHPIYKIYKQTQEDPQDPPDSISEEKNN